MKQGFDGVQERSRYKGRTWNQLLAREKSAVFEIALLYPEWSSREVSCHISDHCGYTVSESTVYRLLNGVGLIRPREEKIFLAKSD